MYAVTLFYTLHSRSIRHQFVDSFWHLANMQLKYNLASKSSRLSFSVFRILKNFYFIPLPFVFFFFSPSVSFCVEFDQIGREISGNRMLGSSSVFSSGDVSQPQDFSPNAVWTPLSPVMPGGWGCVGYGLFSRHVPVPLFQVLGELGLAV